MLMNHIIYQRHQLMRHTYAVKFIKLLADYHKGLSN